MVQVIKRDGREVDFETQLGQRRLPRASNGSPHLQVPFLLCTGQAHCVTLEADIVEAIITVEELVKRSDPRRKEWPICFAPCSFLHRQCRCGNMILCGCAGAFDLQVKSMQVDCVSLYGDIGNSCVQTMHKCLCGEQ